MSLIRLAVFIFAFCLSGLAAAQSPPPEKWMPAIDFSGDQSLSSTWNKDSHEKEYPKPMNPEAMLAVFIFLFGLIFFLARMATRPSGTERIRRQEERFADATYAYERWKTAQERPASGGRTKEDFWQAAGSAQADADKEEDKAEASREEDAKARAARDRARREQQERERREQEAREKAKANAKKARMTLAEAYAYFGLSRDCTAEELKAAHRAKLRKNHPDNFADVDEGIRAAANEIAARMNDARDQIAKDRRFE